MFLQRIAHGPCISLTVGCVAKDKKKTARPRAEHQFVHVEVAILFWYNLPMKEFQNRLHGVGSIRE